MIRVRQVKCKINSTNGEILENIAKRLKVSSDDILGFKINKQSIDARDKNEIYYIYEFDVNVKNEYKILKKKLTDVLETPVEEYCFEISGKNILKNRPVIVGSGPAGLFAGYMLSKYGYKPLIIERGEKIEERVVTVQKFWETGKLNKESNVQFGEGGAGTFSDGKLNTLVKDRLFRNKKVLEIFVECGAPEEILYSNKPHIGTDLLRNVVINLRNKIIEYGGEFNFNSCLKDIVVENGKLKQIQVNDEIIDTDILILAIGHSSRDTFKMLYNKKLNMSSKPFAIGVRVQHKQENINISQYGEKFSRLLPPASYKLTYRSSNGRGVYTFCMCPGGFVVNSSSEENRLVINGMSNYKRDEENANSAVIVTVTSEDFGENALDGLIYQEKLEELTFNKGNGKIPVQLFEDFKLNKVSSDFKDIYPVMKGDYTFVNLREILPEYVSEALIEALTNFDKKIKGFGANETILAAIESRTSSPIKMYRDESGESNIKGIYPCGEGAGYAGGITSSAMDGLKIAEDIAKIYKNEI